MGQIHPHLTFSNRFFSRFTNWKIYGTSKKQRSFRLVKCVESGTWKLGCVRIRLTMAVLEGMGCPGEGKGGVVNPTGNTLLDLRPLSLCMLSQIFATKVYQLGGPSRLDSLSASPYRAAFYWVQPKGCKLSSKVHAWCAEYHSFNPQHLQFKSHRWQVVWKPEVLKSYYSSESMVVI